MDGLAPLVPSELVLGVVIPKAQGGQKINVRSRSDMTVGKLKRLVFSKMIQAMEENEMPSGHLHVHDFRLATRPNMYEKVLHNEKARIASLFVIHLPHLEKNLYFLNKKMLRKLKFQYEQVETLQDYIQKKTSQPMRMGTKWMNRWFKLSGGRLSYWTTRHDVKNKRPNGKFTTANIDEVKQRASRATRLTITFKNKPRVLDLLCRDREQATTWKDALLADKEMKYPGVESSEEEEGDRETEVERERRERRERERLRRAKERSRARGVMTEPDRHLLGYLQKAKLIAHEQEREWRQDNEYEARQRVGPGASPIRRRKRSPSSRMLQEGDTSMNNGLVSRTASPQKQRGRFSRGVSPVSPKPSSPRRRIGAGESANRIAPRRSVFGNSWHRDTEDVDAPRFEKVNRRQHDFHKSFLRQHTMRRNRLDESLNVEADRERGSSGKKKKRRRGAEDEKEEENGDVSSAYSSSSSSSSSEASLESPDTEENEARERMLKTEHSQHAANLRKRNEEDRRTRTLAQQQSSVQLKRQTSMRGSARTEVERLEFDVDDGSDDVDEEARERFRAEAARRQEHIRSPRRRKRRRTRRSAVSVPEGSSDGYQEEDGADAKSADDEKAPDTSLHEAAVKSIKESFRAERKKAMDRAAELEDQLREKERIIAELANGHVKSPTMAASSGDDAKVDHDDSKDAKDDNDGPVVRDAVQNNPTMPPPAASMVNRVGSDPLMNLLSSPHRLLMQMKEQDLKEANLKAQILQQQLDEQEARMQSLETPIVTADPVRPASVLPPASADPAPGTSTYTAGPPSDRLRRLMMVAEAESARWQQEYLAADAQRERLLRQSTVTEMPMTSLAATANTFADGSSSNSSYMPVTAQSFGVSADTPRAAAPFVASHIAEAAAIAKSMDSGSLAERHAQRRVRYDHQSATRAYRGASHSPPQFEGRPPISSAASAEIGRIEQEQLARHKRREERRRAQLRHGGAASAAARGGGSAVLLSAHRSSPNVSLYQSSVKVPASFQRRGNSVVARAVPASLPREGQPASSSISPPSRREGDVAKTIAKSTASIDSASAASFVASMAAEDERMRERRLRRERRAAERAKLHRPA